MTYSLLHIANFNRPNGDTPFGFISLKLRDPNSVPSYCSFPSLNQLNILWCADMFDLNRQVYFFTILLCVYICIWANVENSITCRCKPTLACLKTYNSQQKYLDLHTVEVDPLKRFRFLNQFPQGEMREGRVVWRDVITELYVALKMTPW